MCSCLCSVIDSHTVQVVITPAYTAPSVTNATQDSSTGAALWQKLTSSFGYLNKEVGCTSMHAEEYMRRPSTPLHPAVITA